jgi:hypothetical protein
VTVFARLPWVKTGHDGLKRVAHDPETHEMWAEFASGNVWRFQGVPRRFYTNLLNAANPCRHFRRHFVGRFEGERVRTRP